MRRALGLITLPVVILSSLAILYLANSAWAVVALLAIVVPPSLQLLVLPDSRFLTKLLRISYPIAVLLLFFLIQQAIWGGGGRLLAFIPVTGLLLGLLTAMFLVACIQRTFVGIHNNSVFLEFADEQHDGHRMELAANLKAAVTSLISAIVGSFTLWLLCHCWLVLLYRVLRSGERVEEGPVLWLLTALSVAMAFSVRMMSFLASTRESRALTGSFFVSLLLSTFVAVPSLAGLQGTDIHPSWFPLITTPSGFSFAITTCGIMAGLAGSVSGELLIYAMMPFLDLDRTYFDFLSEGGAKARTIADSRARFIGAASELVRLVRKNGRGLIRIATQTAGQEWGSLQDILLDILNDKRLTDHVTIEILCPPHPANLTRIAAWMKFPNVKLYCSEVHAYSETKFMIVNSPGLYRVLLGRPSAVAHDRHRIFPMARWGYVFEDPIIVAQYDTLYTSMAQKATDRRTVIEVLASTLCQHSGLEGGKIVSNGLAEAVWLSGKDDRFLRLSVKAVDVTIEMSESVAQIFPKSVEQLVAAEIHVSSLRNPLERADVLFLDFDGVCIGTTHFVELAGTLGQREAAVSIVEGYTRNDDRDLEMRLRQLARLCQGLPYDAFEGVANRTEIIKSARTLIEKFMRNNQRVVVVTNGVTSFVRLSLKKASIEVTEVWGNELEFNQGICSGTLRGSLVTSYAKRDVVKVYSTIGVGKVVAIGNGMNDLHMFDAVCELKGKAFLLSAEGVPVGMQNAQGKVRAVKSLDEVESKLKWTKPSSA